MSFHDHEPGRHDAGVPATPGNNEYYPVFVKDKARQTFADRFAASKNFFATSSGGRACRSDMLRLSVMMEFWKTGVEDYDNLSGSDFDARSSR